MKSIFVMMLVGLFAFSATPATPAYAGEKGASAMGYEHASENSVFNRVGDWFATIGKSGAEKDQILAERKAARMKKHAEKEAKKMGKSADSAGKDMKKKVSY